MSDNPKVNRCLKDQSFDHIDHALGRPAWPLKTSYRNYFATDAGGEEARSFAKSPLWRIGSTDGRLIFFHVTEAGRQALAAHLRELGADSVFLVTFNSWSSQVPAATPAKARYERYLFLRDIIPDLTFLEFLRRARVRKVSA